MKKKLLSFVLFESLYVNMDKLKATLNEDEA